MQASNNIKINPGFIPESMATPSIEYEYLSDELLPYHCDESVTDLVIPCSAQGYPITEIDYSGFCGYTNLESVVISEGVRVINHAAFAGCTNLREVTIPASMEYIDQEAFCDCDKLERVYITDLGAWLKIDFDWGDANPLEYSHRLYLNGEPVTDIEIPYGVKEIKNCAFSGLSNLKSLTIPHSVTRIEEDAFSGVADLEKLIMPCTVARIKDNAFGGCKNLTVYAEASSLPMSWQKEDKAKYEIAWDHGDCKVVWGYNNITANEQYDYVVHDGKAYLTKYKGWSTEVVVPSTIDGLEVADICLAFHGNSYITSVTLPSSIDSVGDYAFYHCTSLEDIVMPGVTSIGIAAFSGCESLISADIPSGVTSIGYYAFQSCTSLSAIFLPSCLAEIGVCAFLGCTSLIAYVECRYDECKWRHGCYGNLKQIVWDYQSVAKDLRNH